MHHSHCALSEHVICMKIKIPPSQEGGKQVMKHTNQADSLTNTSKIMKLLGLDLPNL